MAARRKKSISKGYIRFFKVDRFGFYQRKNKNTTLVNGDMGELLSLFCDWTVGRDMTQTIPWDPEVLPDRQQIYCKNVAHNTSTGDYLLVLWKAFPTDSGKVSGVKASAKVGDDTSDSVKVEAESKGEPIILGDPMYYWFIPQHNLIATVKFPHSSSATQHACDYLRRCIEYRIDHPAKEIEERRNADNEVIRKIRFKAPNSGYMNLRIEAHLQQLKSNVADAKALSKKITHLVIRDTISSDVLNSTKDKNALFRLLFEVKKLSGNADKTKQKIYKRIEVIEERTLTSREVSEILKAHGSDRVLDDGWEDIGFKVEGSNGVSWFSKYVNTEHIVMHALPGEVTWYTAKSILREITRNRDNLLQQFIGSSTRSGSG